MNLKKIFLIAVLAVTVQTPVFSADGVAPNNEDYCESKYFLDDSRCVDWETTYIDQKLCDSIKYKSSETVCLKILEAIENGVVKQEKFNNENYCEPVHWEDENCSNEGYCESIYWEDEDNCIDWEDDLEEISLERCEELYGDTQTKCFELLADGKK